MKISLIYISNDGQDIEHLGIASIAAFLRKYNIDISLNFFGSSSTVDDIINEISLTDDVYGFSLFHTNADRVLKLSSLLKERNVNCRVFLGGHLATDTAEYLLNDFKSIDFIVLGHGENPLLSIIRAIECGEDISEIPSVATRKRPTGIVPAHINICDVPWPSRDYIKEGKANYWFTRLNASRGCCGNCTFCSNNSFLNTSALKQWQGRDIDDVFNEIIAIYEEYGIRCFVFNDASFEDPGKLGKQRIEKLCNLLIEYPVKFGLWCFLRAESFNKDDIPLIKLMRKAGFTQVFIGVEAANEFDLKLYNKRSTVNDNERAIKLFRENDIEVIIGFIIFNSFSSMHSLRANYEFLRDFNAYHITHYINELEVRYNTPIYHHLKKQKLLGDNYSYLNPIGYNFTQPDVFKMYEFVRKVISKSPIIKEEFGLIAFDNLWNGFRAFYNNELDCFKEELQTIRNKLASELSSFFEHLYIHNDLKYSVENFGSFENRIMNIFSEYNSFKIRLLKKEPFRSYFSRRM